MTRKTSTNSEFLAFKVHPDMKAHVIRRAQEEYCSDSEYIRRLIVADMRKTATTEEDEA